jgi:hypothetical protein
VTVSFWKGNWLHGITRAVCKFRGLEPVTPSRNFVEVRWRSLLENVLQTVDRFEISCLLGAPFSWLEKPRNRMGRDLNWILCSAWKKWLGGTPLENSPYSPDLAPRLQPPASSPQPPIQWVPGALSLAVKRPGREADHSPPSSAETKNAWSYTSSPQYVFMA